MSDVPILSGDVSIWEWQSPGPVATAYLQSTAPLDAIMGPAGSGKTMTSCVKCALQTLRMPVMKDGVIRALGTVVRDNYRTLYRTTLESWFRVFPRNFPGSHFEGGQDRPAKHRITFRTPRGQLVEMTVDFYAVGDHAIEDLLKLPKDADGYAFEPSDKLKPYLPDFANDPVLKLARDAAHKAGIREKQFAPFVNGILEAMVEGELVTPAIDLAAEKAALLPEEARGLDETGKNTAIDRRVRDNHARIEIWKSQGLPEASATALAAMLDTAAANQAVEFFATQMRTPQPTTGGSQAQGVTHESVKARQSDPRNKVGNSKFDPAFAAETNRMYQSLFPGGAA